MTTQEPGEREERHVEHTETIDEGRVVRPEDLPDPSESDVKDEQDTTDTSSEESSSGESTEE